MTFTEAERRYLDEQPLARIATASATGVPDVAPVTFTLDGDTFTVAGMDMAKTLKYRNAQTNPRATIVVDDLASVTPWRPRGLKVRGRVVVEGDGARAVLRIVPETVWSWGLNIGAETHFGPIEKRQVG